MIGLVTWWMVQEHLTPGRRGKIGFRMALAAQVAALLPVLLVLLMEYEQTLIIRRSMLAYRWALQAPYYPIFIAYLTFSVAVAVARAIGPAVVVVGSVIAYLLLLAFSLLLQGAQPMASPVPFFLALIVVAAVILWVPGPAGDIAACLAAVPVLYLSMTLAARPCPTTLGRSSGRRPLQSPQRWRAGSSAARLRWSHTRVLDLHPLLVLVLEAAVIAICMAAGVRAARRARRTS